MSVGWLDSMGGAGQSAERAFGEAKGSGYRDKTVTQSSPLLCPKCGAAASGTRERLKCNACGFIDSVQEKTRPKLGVVEYPCPQCSQALTICGDRRSCNGCGYSG
jgi:ribosomal protein S27AE